MLLVLAAAAFWSCSDDSTTDPNTNTTTNTVTCSIITPADNSGVKPGSTINCQFKIKAKTELITDVRFFVDGTLTGTMSVQSTPQDTLKSYNWSIPSTFTGTHKIWAIARDEAGVEGKSAELNIHPAGSLIVTGSYISFGSTMVGTSSSEQNFSVYGSNLQSAVTVTAPNGFEVSTTFGSNFTASVSVTTVGGNVASTTIYVRFTPSAAQSYSGTITCVASGAAAQNVSVTGTEMQTNPHGATSGSERVVRGGSYFHDNYCRVAIRYYYSPSNRCDCMGFRLVRSL